MNKKLPVNRALPLISVVVPVYNVEQYLEECIDSILDQTYPNIEVVLVDDGSTDGCSALCDRYASRYGNVKVIHRENGGLSAARNTGVSYCNGEYVSFIDSDDYVSPLFLEALYRAILHSGTKIAALRAGIDFFDGDDPRLCEDLETASEYELLNDEQFQAEILYQKSWSAVQCRLYARELTEKVYFPEGLFYEDDEASYRFVHECNAIAVLRVINLYAYRQRPNSIMRGAFNPRKMESCLEITRRMRRNMADWYPQLTDATCSRCFAICRVVFSQIPKDDKEAQLVMWKELQEYSATVVCDPQARKKEKIAARVSRMGLGPFRAFCDVYQKLLRS